MRKFYYLFVLIFMSNFSNAQNPDAFIMTVEVGENPDLGISGLDITIPIEQNFNNNYTINFGDGTVLNNQTGNVSHTYTNEGIYTLVITGNFNRICFGCYYSNFKIKSVEQWGTNQWHSMEDAFSGCANLIINATDTPDLSQTTSMRGMFFNATSFNQSINNWDVSSITNMEFMFNGATSFNQPLDNWDVSNVVDMNSMFDLAVSFNQPLNNWDVSNVVDMGQMFANTQTFNQPLNNWNVSSVTNMMGMFAGTISFNQPLNDWDVSNVTNMFQMFGFAESFNQPLNNWDVSNVIDMENMFEHTIFFNQPLDGWDVSNVDNFWGMFSSAASFNQSLNNWNVSSATNMVAMFAEATEFNQPLNDWDVSNVTNMAGMFRNAESFDQPLNNWEISNVTYLASMFSGATSFNQPLDDWDVSNVIDMGGMFNNAINFNQNISNWNFNNNIMFSANNLSYGFVSNSGLDQNNYDDLLLRFAQLGLENKTFVATNLDYCDVIVKNYLIDELGWTIIGDSLGENCEYNIVFGNVLLDENNDGCDVNDTILDVYLVNAYNGTTHYSVFPNTGEYTLNLMDNTYTVSLLNVSDYFTVTPESYSISFTGFGNSEELIFCLTANQIIEDLNIALLPKSQARPGFEAEYQLVVQNMGTQTVTNAQVSLTFDDTMQSFVSATPAETSVTTSQLNFEIASLPPFGNTVIDFTMQTFTPPTVNGDDILNFAAVVTPNSNDYTPDDNTFELAQVVVNAYDPNDKQVLQGDKIHIDNVDEYLHYLIRFQNTGTASAINVRIEDELHETLDWNTIQIINASHDYRVEITEGNQIEFIFDNIHLPHETDDEAGSNGFIAYKIKPVQDLEVGDFIIGNEAEIYFDFNEPIITNTTSTEIVNPTSGIVTNLSDFIWVYPNPTSDVLHIQTKGNIELQEVKIYNMQGRELYASQQYLQTVNIMDLSSGIYLLNIKTNEGTINQRVIKK